MNPYVLLAKSAVENYIKERKTISLPDDLSGEFLSRKAGAFVTIEKDGQLRGCIGTYLPTKENIATEIISNAIVAATEDYRFGPIKKEELPYLSYTVYILSEPELIKDIEELDPKKFGIIVKTIPIASSTRAVAKGEEKDLSSSPTGIDVLFNGHSVPKSGLLLPNLEGIDTIEKQISVACQKGGINPIKEKGLIYKFTVEKYE